MNYRTVFYASRRGATLCGLLLLSCLWGHSSLTFSQSFNFTLDFEEGNFRGWKVIRKTGNAFRCQPTIGDAPRARGKETANHQGKYWIGTFECNNRLSAKTSRAKRLSKVQRDRPRGILRSANFTIPNGYLRFRIGGGRSDKTQVQLFVHDGTGEFKERIRLRESGRNSETMREVRWDLRRYAGKVGHLRIVDMSSGPWGHINVDYFRFIRLVKMPNLIRMDQRRAILVLRRLKLKLAKTIFVKANQAANTVFKQRPRAGLQVSEGRAVTLYLAKKKQITPKLVRVPNLIRRPFSEVLEMLGEIKLKIRVEDYVESNQPVKSIVSQKPRAGTRVRIGTVISLVLAKQARVRVPDLLNLDEESARVKLGNIGLRLGELSKIEKNNSPGLILRQMPAAGELVKSGSAVNITVAVVALVTVPQVVGNNIRQARQAMVNAGLALPRVNKRISNSRKSGTVLEQNPAAGAKVHRGYQVSLIIAKNDLIIVPNVRGYSYAQAKQILKKAGLRLGHVDRIEATSAVGKISKQNPVQQSKAKKGSVVNLVLVIEKKSILPAWSWLAGGAVALLLTIVTVVRVIKGSGKASTSNSDGAAVGGLEIRAVMDEGEQSLDVEGSLVKGDNDE